MEKAYYRRTFKDFMTEGKLDDVLKTVNAIIKHNPKNKNEVMRNYFRGVSTRSLLGLRHHNPEHESINHINNELNNRGEK
jgi:hypothetical protein